MVMPPLDDGTWCYWLVSGGTVLSFVGLLAACICGCRRNENKSEFLGLAGMVTITHPDNEGFNRLPTSDVTQPLAQDAVDSGKRVSGANRSLPDLPKDRSVSLENRVEPASRDVIYEANEVGGDPSELYATVQDKNTPNSRRSESEALSDSQQNSLSKDDVASPYARLKGPKSSGDEHPYAQVQSVQKSEANPQTRNPTSHLTDTNTPSTSSDRAGGNPVAPPRTRRSSSHNSLLSSEPQPDIQAASAITGGVQANQDLPYMTPPILPPLPRPPQSETRQQQQQQQHFSGDSQDSKGYTSISVREPLANIIAQTKAAQQQQRQPHARALIDPHYATVSDDSDEMYAAIDEQEKVYTSGSETYAQIQPMATDASRVAPSEQASSGLPCHGEEAQHPSAPQPPSVDSLRHVAHAHSRQASSSSATSSVANLGSPKPEKRQANSPLPPPPPEGGAAPDLYASVDKRPKSEDRTRSSVSSGKSLEDMYAKVVKKKREADEEQPDSGHGTTTTTTTTNSCELPLTSRKLSLVEMSRTSWSSHDSVEIQKKRDSDPFHFSAVALSSVVVVNNNNCNSFHGEADAEYAKPKAPPRKGGGGGGGGDADLSRLSSDPGYEAVGSKGKIASSLDPNYEVLRPQRPSRDESSRNQGNAAARNGTDAHAAPFTHRQVSNASSEDPGYEKVRLRRRTADLDPDTDSEPNYESMPHDSGEPNYASVCRPCDSDTDPNYESVNQGDPNYESVRYASVTQSEEPPYEQVRNRAAEELDPSGYERIRKKPYRSGGGGGDPDYEKIKLNYFAERTNDEETTDDEQYVQV